MENVAIESSLTYESRSVVKKLNLPILSMPIFLPVFLFSFCFSRIGLSTCVPFPYILQATAITVFDIGIDMYLLTTRLMKKSKILPWKSSLTLFIRNDITSLCSKCTPHVYLNGQVPHGQPTTSRMIVAYYCVYNKHLLLQSPHNDNHCQLSILWFLSSLVISERSFVFFRLFTKRVLCSSSFKTS